MEPSGRGASHWQTVNCQAVGTELYNHPPMTVTIRSFAKINLGLYIGPRRDDGFHELLTVYQTIALYDLIRVGVGRGSGIEIQCDDPRVPCQESNTCFRIAEKALIALGAKARVVIEIEKRLPVQGGLGGASSNAVAVLLGLERVLQKRLSAEQRLKIAAEVGSDLPLSLVGGTVLGVGRGEQVYPIEDLPKMACVVVTPEIGVSTPKAFADWDRRMERGLKLGYSWHADAALKRRSSTVDPEAHAPVAESLRGESSVRFHVGQPGAAVPTLTVPALSDRMNELGLRLSAGLSESYSGAPFRRGRLENPLLGLVRAGIKNDFEQVVFPEYPELSAIKTALERAGAKYASLSGSGSSVYGLFASTKRARAAAEKLRKQGWAAQATATVTRRQYWKAIFG
jgi:4-diphosphocytidyl-2-C-methyl-D-erythritol kinase